MNTIINVGRQFGSGGGYVAQAVGKKLGIPVYDNELISKAAEESGYSKSVFEGGEQRKSLFSMSSFFSSGRLGFGETGFVNDDMLFKIQSEVIRNIAEKGDAIAPTTSSATWTAWTCSSARPWNTASSASCRMKAWTRTRPKP